MIRRRDLPLAAVAHGLAICSGAAYAQKKGSAKNKKRVDATSPPIRADERVNQVLAPIRDEHHLPGLIGAIVMNNRLAAIGALGIRKIGSSDPIRVTDQVHLGSCTKAMTATMIGTLVDEGKLSWATTISDVFPDVAAQLHDDFQAVTLSHLLTHRAGLPHDGRWWRLSGETTTAQRRELLTSMLGGAPLSRPGSTYAYSNVGYALAALMSEQVTGQSWEALMRTRLFEPLGMGSAGFGSPGHAGRVDQPWGHRPVGDEVRPTQQDNAPAMAPAAGVHCSVPDWAKFAAAHLRGARGQAKLLKRSTFRALQTPPPGMDYAGGWLIFDRSWAGGRALNHGGSNESWYAVVWLAPARDFGILTATNQGGESAKVACDQASSKLIESLAFLT
jgi:CubicO group peptidase (beta-lactamase class C family)